MNLILDAVMLFISHQESVQTSRILNGLNVTTALSYTSYSTKRRAEATPIVNIADIIPLPLAENI